MITVPQTATIYNRYRSLINKYRGGMPGGFTAAIIAHESGGNVAASGDASLGEQGLFQTTRVFPSSVGVNPSVRGTAEGAIFLGLLEYQILPIQLKLWAPGLIQLGSEDSWKLARLGFSIGMGGTRTLIKAATGMTSGYYGRVFDAVRAYVDTTNGVSLGSQSAQKVHDRVHGVDDQWDIGSAVAYPILGKPERIPAPSGLSYTLPAGIEQYMSISQTSKTLILIGAVAVTCLAVYALT